MAFTKLDIWKKDGVTRDYKKKMGDILNTPTDMTPKELANTTTYCNSWDNPYTIELMRRSGHLEAYQGTFDDKERRKIFDKSCAYHGFKVV